VRLFLVFTLALALLPAAAVNAQATRTLRLFPSPVVVAPGESVEVTAWFCRLPEAGDPFGPDGTPGTDDDACQRVRVAWATEDQRVARARPQRSTTTTVTGRRDGLTSLSATYQATSTSSFVSRIGVDVSEPLPDATTDDADAADGAEATAPDVATGIVLQPEFAILAPGDSQIFTAYECAFVGNPRGADGIPGTSDDLCRPTEVRWGVLGEPPAGSVDPSEGYFTVFTAAGQVASNSAFVAFVVEERPAMAESRLTAAEEGQTTPGSSSATGAVSASKGQLTAVASLQIDQNAEPRPQRVPGDADGDGEVHLEDLAYITALLGTRTGDPGFDPGADFDDSGFIDFADAYVVASNFPPL